MSGTYNTGKTRLATGELDWDEGTKTFNVIALESTYVFDADHDSLADIVAEELTGTGTRAAVANRAVSKNLTNDRAELTADDTTLPSIDAGTIGFLAVYEDIGSVDSDKKLVAWLSADGAGASFDLATNGADVLVAWPGGRVTRIE